MSYDEDDGFEDGFKINSYDEDDELIDGAEDYDLEEENPEKDS